ncbi:hypothetical protein MNV49_007160 [Pseudohyphozyma bogoriensis]|nr:hypothetical protein MNV49_007160 [Pseudohyphozyma bogoriensis]
MTYISTNSLRSKFSAALSDLYKNEVPLYGKLIELVHDTNKPLLGPLSAEERARLSQERHGAIRVGTPDELKTLARIFAQMGMSPVGYYDLSVAGHPVHATAFRPIEHAALLINPFRVFCSLLRFDLIPDPEIRQLAQETLARRNIFTPKLITLLEQAEKDGGLTEASATTFVSEALETFKWHSTATVSSYEYERLSDVSKLVADIVSFPGPHINHLTPCTLDIDVVQESMISRGIPPKSVIEGPPARLCPILLRQTSFRALEERVIFENSLTHSQTLGHHTARFGEIESRGAALTPKGRQLFDDLFDQARATEVTSPSASHVEIEVDGEGGHRKEKVEESANVVHQRHLSKFFAQFPDSWERLRGLELVFFKYEVVEGKSPTKGTSLEALLAAGCVTYKPLTYEDFLPASAAGIFASNLSKEVKVTSKGTPDQDGFEKALGKSVVDPNEIYAETQRRSLEEVYSHFGRAL